VRSGRCTREAGRNSFERVGVDGPLDTCGCGAVPAWGQRSRFMGNNSLERWYQCAAAAQSVRTTGGDCLALPPLRRGCRPAPRSNVAAPAERPRATRYSFSWWPLCWRPYRGVLRWRESRARHGQARGCVELEVRVEVPGSMGGRLSFAVVGVVNGASCIVRQMIEVEH